jgi:hypothetical protein
MMMGKKHIESRIFRIFFFWDNTWKWRFMMDSSVARLGFWRVFGFNGCQDGLDTQVMMKTSYCFYRMMCFGGWSPEEMASMYGYETRLPLAWSSLFFSVLFVFGGGIIGWLESDI